MKMQLDQTALEAQQLEEANQHQHVVIVAKERRHCVWSSTHGFTLLRLNNPQAKLPYYTIRCKRHSMNRSIKNMLMMTPNSVVIYRNGNVANPVNLYDRFKKCGIDKYNGNYCHSLVSDEELVRKLEELRAIDTAAESTIKK